MPQAPVAPVIPPMSALVLDPEVPPSRGAPSMFPQPRPAAPAAPRPSAPPPPEAALPPALGDEPEVVEARAILAHPPEAGGEIRKNPEPIVASMVAALIASGQATSENIKTVGRAVWNSTLELCEEIRSGALDSKFGLDTYAKQIARKVADLDRDAIGAKRDYDKRFGDITALAPDDPRMERYQAELAKFRETYTSAKREHDRLALRVLPRLYELSGR